jgi:hypothetical protein
MASEAHLHRKLEPPDIPVRAVLVAACATLLLVIGAVIGLDAVYRAYVPNPAPPPPQTFPEPRVHPYESEELRRLLAEQRARLGRYAWVDRDKGVVEIPIEQAMRLIAEKGAHAYDPIETSAPALSSPKAGAQRATTTGQGAPAGPARPPPATSGAAPSSGQDGEAKP